MKSKFQKSLPLYSEFLSHIAYDSVVFGFNNSQLKILIMEYHNTGLFALPGGFVRLKEDLNSAVKRGLAERTGIENIYLEQFYTFGSYDRHDPAIMRKIMEGNGFEIKEDHWMLERFISVAYYALIDFKKVTLKPDMLSDSIKWYDVDAVPNLILDHNKIVDKALQTLQDGIYKRSIGRNLLPVEFTMKELQTLYESILRKTIHRSAFQRKILNMGILERKEKLYSGKPHKAPYLYSFK